MKLGESQELLLEEHRMSLLEFCTILSQPSLEGISLSNLKQSQRASLVSLYAGP